MRNFVLACGIASKHKDLEISRKWAPKENTNLDSSHMIYIEHNYRGAASREVRYSSQDLVVAPMAQRARANQAFKPCMLKYVGTDWSTSK